MPPEIVSWPRVFLPANIFCSPFDTNCFYLANDVEHVILDNLQFMTGSQYRGFEKFDVMDMAIEKLRKFATMKQV